MKKEIEAGGVVGAILDTAADKDNRQMLKLYGIAQGFQAKAAQIQFARRLLELEEWKKKQGL